MNLPPTSGPRANSGVSRLAMMQARLQAQQLVEREQKIIHFLEERQEEAIRRIAYSTVGRDSSHSAHSANSLSSNNSNNSGSVRAGQLTTRSAVVRSDSNNHISSPIGWDKSYPLRPMGDPGLPPTEITRTPSIGSGLYKRNSTAGLSNLSGNKYSGGYGPKGSYVARNRGFSLDRMQGSSLQTSPTRRPSYGMTRTRSQAQILGHSSGEDSYASSSRPPSTYDTYSSTRHEVNLNRSNSHLYGNRNANNTAISETIYIDGPGSPPGNRKTSYTREYVRNLPSVSGTVASAPAARGRLNRRRETSPQRINTSAYDHSSYSSQSSEKSETGGNGSGGGIYGPSLTLLNATPKTNRRDIEDNRTFNDTYKYDTRPRINSQTFRKSRSPGKRSSRSPSRSPGRSPFGSDENDRVNNNETASGPSATPSTTGNSTFLQQQKSIREREEEKRRLQAEMRRREQELLAKIKEQQRELESMKHEKGKVERELHRQELMRERDRKMVEEKLEQFKPNATIQRAPLTKRQIAVSRSSSSATSSSASKPDHEDEEDEEEEERSPRRSNRVEPTRRMHPPLAKTLSQDKTRSRISNPSPAVARRNVSNSRSQIPNSPSLTRRNQSPITTNRRTQSDQRRKEPPSNNATTKKREPLTLSSLRAAAGNTNPPPTQSQVSNSQPTGSTPAPVRKPMAKKPAANKVSKRRTPSPPFYPKHTDYTSHTLSSSLRASAERELPENTPVAPSAAPAGKPKPVKTPVTKRKTVKSEPDKNPPARLSRLLPKPRDDLVSCNNCGRNFAEDRIDKHQEICFKTASKKRKTFDMAKQRLEGTDAESFVKRKGRGQRGKMQSSQKEEPSKKKSDWRKKRAEFISALRAAKEAQRHLAAGGKISDLPPPPPSDTSDYIQCPHCGRRFNESAADRHIPKCKNIISNKRR